MDSTGTTNLALSLTESQILAALRAFLLQVVPTNIEIIAGLDNRVGEPQGDYLLMTPIVRTRLSTNIDNWSPLLQPAPTTLQVSNTTRYDVQVDCYGTTASDNAQVIAMLFRDQFGVAVFQNGGLSIAPLYATDPRQMSFVNGESQYEKRWTLDLSLEIDPIVTLIQDFAAEIKPTLTSVEATYPP